MPGCPTASLPTFIKALWTPGTYSHRIHALKPGSVVETGGSVVETGCSRAVLSHRPEPPTRQRGRGAEGSVDTGSREEAIREEQDKDLS